MLKTHKSTSKRQLVHWTILYLIVPNKQNIDTERLGSKRFLIS